MRKSPTGLDPISRKMFGDFFGERNNDRPPLQHPLRGVVTLDDRIDVDVRRAPVVSGQTIHNGSGLLCPFIRAHQQTTVCVFIEYLAERG